MTQDIHVGRLISEFANYQGWSKEDLERILGISTSNMYKKLKMSDIDTTFVKRVAKAAGIEVPELFAFGLSQIGVVNAVGKNTIHYKTNSSSSTERILRERVAGLESENQALKDHIKTLNRLIDSYDRSK